MTCTLEIQKIGITELDTDCIVNAANRMLLAGSGVCGAVFREAGYEELTEACRDIGVCETGNSVITPGFRLKAKYIIHTVGPVYEGGGKGEAKKLASCYRTALDLALDNGCMSIGFPLISAGIYGYPATEAWRTALSSVNEWIHTHACENMQIIFAVVDDRMKVLGETLLNEMYKMLPAQKSDSRFVFFWKPEDENGYLSQWFEASFRIEGITYRFAEQYMMAKKALLFRDFETYNEIMDAEDPQECKRLGKKVKPFDPVVWDNCCEEIVYRGNLAKFSQNAGLRNALSATGNRYLAEASPWDKIWGIGMRDSDPNAGCPDKWQGKNLLGNILMKVRTELEKK